MYVFITNLTLIEKIDLPSSTWHDIKVEFIMLLTKYAVSESTVMTQLQQRRIPKLPKGYGDDLYNCSFCQIHLLIVLKYFDIWYFIPLADNPPLYSR